LGPFADSHARHLSDAEFLQFEDLLDQLDHDLYAWITGAEPIPPQFDHDVMRRLRAFRPADVAPDTPRGEPT
jgi:antitoxin CptB